jgi:hypothetical protein
MDVTEMECDVDWIALAEDTGMRCSGGLISMGTYVRFRKKVENVLVSFEQYRGLDRTYSKPL